MLTSKRNLLIAVAAISVTAGPASALDLGGTLNGVTGSVANITTSSPHGNSNSGSLNGTLANVTGITGAASATHTGNSGNSQNDGDATSSFGGLLGLDSGSLVSLDANDEALHVGAANANKLTASATASQVRSGNTSGGSLTDRLDKVVNLKGFEQADQATVRDGKIILGAASATDAAVHADKDSLNVGVGTGVAGAAHAKTTKTETN